MAAQEGGLDDVLAALRRSWPIGAAVAIAVAAAGLVSVATTPVRYAADTVVGFAPRGTANSSADTLRLVVDRYTVLASSGPLTRRAELAAALPPGALRGEVDAQAAPLTVNVTVTVTGPTAAQAVAGADAVARQLVAASGADDIVLGQVLDPADPAAVTVRPNTRLLSIVIVLLALGLGLATTLVLGRRRRRLRDPRLLVRAATGGDVLAVLPRRRALRRLGAVLVDPVGAATVLELRRTLPSRPVGDGRAACIVAVTSPGQGDGRSTVALLLAQAASAAGRVLLVDADVSRPALSYALELEERQGLMEALATEGPLAPFVHAGPVPGVDVLPSRSGGRPPETAALRGLARRGDYAVIVLDGPPLVVGGAMPPDTRAVLEAAGAVVLAVRGRGDRRRLAVAASLLAGGPAALVGSVLVGTPPRAARPGRGTA